MDKSEQLFINIINPLQKGHLKNLREGRLFLKKELSKCVQAAHLYSQLPVYRPWYPAVKQILTFCNFILIFAAAINKTLNFTDCC